MHAPAISLIGSIKDFTLQINLDNTSLTLQWQVQNDEFVKITIRKNQASGAATMPAELSVLAKLTIDSPANASGATFLVPLKQAVSGGSGQIPQLHKFDPFDPEIQLYHQLQQDRLRLGGFARADDTTGSEQFLIEFDKDLLEDIVNHPQRQGNVNIAFTATINLVAFEKNLSEKVIKQAKAHRAPNDVAATEMLKELHIKLSDPSSADCIIICQGKRLPSHKYILSLRSKVFEVNRLIF